MSSESFRQSKNFLHIDAIKIYEDYLEIQGWAIAKNGVSDIEVHADEVFLGKAMYGICRPDVKAKHNDLVESDELGFLFLPELSSRHFREGEIKKIVIRVFDKSGSFSDFVQEIIVKKSHYLEYLEKNYFSPSIPEESLVLSKKINFTFVVLVNDFDDINSLKRTIGSLFSQSYDFWDFAVLTENSSIDEKNLQYFLLSYKERFLGAYDLEGLNRWIFSSEADFLAFIPAGDVVMNSTLFQALQRIFADEKIALIYCDNDELIGGKRANPFFKPSFSPEIMWSMNYIGNFFILKTKTFNEAGGLSSFSMSGRLYDLLMRCIALGIKIEHIPIPLHTSANLLISDVKENQRILNMAMEARKIDGEIVVNAQLTGLKYKIDGNPKVSIVMLTGCKRPELLINCLKSIFEKSSYGNYEIILVDNSQGRFDFKLIEEIIPEGCDFRIENEFRFKEFNFSKLNNFAARRSAGEYLILLNDDTEIISCDWIEAMLQYAQLPEVGVVGAKLLYKNDLLQHGGVFIVDDDCGAAHMYQFMDGRCNAYHNFLNVVRNCSAVTFACAMIPRRVFDLVGGLNENLKIVCNDPDFCFSCIQNNKSVVWTPFAYLYHIESANRKKGNCEADVDFFWKKWEDKLTDYDPFYSPNLSLDTALPLLNDRPLVLHYGNNLIKSHKEKEGGQKNEKIILFSLDNLFNFDEVEKFISIMLEKLKIKLVFFSSKNLEKERILLKKFEKYLLFPIDRQLQVNLQSLLDIADVVVGGFCELTKITSTINMPTFLMLMDQSNLKDFKLGNKTAFISGVKKKDGNSFDHYETRSLTGKKIFEAFKRFYFLMENLN